MVRWRLLLLALAVLVGLLLFYPRTCSDVERQAIIVSPTQVTVANLTEVGWSNVEVWLNDQYRGQASSLAPGQRLEMPARGFVAGWGQYFDPVRQAPYGIDVTAKGADGRQIHLTWGKGRRR